MWNTFFSSLLCPPSLMEIKQFTNQNGALLHRQPEKFGPTVLLSPLSFKKSKIADSCGHFWNVNTEPATENSRKKAHYNSKIRISTVCGPHLPVISHLIQTEIRCSWEHCKGRPAQQQLLWPMLHHTPQASSILVLHRLEQLQHGATKSRIKIRTFYINTLTLKIHRAGHANDFGP